jgi:hypothetical protein
MAYDAALYYGGHLTPIAAASTSFADAVVLPASRMVASRKYLLLVTAGVASHSAVAGGSNGMDIRVLRGASVSLGSESYYPDFFNGALPEVDDRHVRPYSYMTVFTQPGTPVDIRVQLAQRSGQTSGHLYDCTITVLDIHSLVENTDYVFDEEDDSGAPVSLPVDVGGTLPASHESFASLTLPGGAAYWLVIGHVCEHNTLKQGRWGEFYLSDGGAKRLIYYDTSSPANSLANFVISNVPGVGTKTVTVKGYSKTDDFGAVYPRHHSSRIFALKFTPGGASIGHGVGADLGEPAFREDTGIGPGSAAPGGGLTPSAEQSWMWFTAAFGTGNTPVSISQQRNVLDSSTMNGEAWPAGCDHTVGSWGLRHPVMRVSALRCASNEVLGDRFEYSTAGATIEGDCYVGGYRRFFLRLDTWDATSDGVSQTAPPTAAGTGSTDRPELFGSGSTSTASPVAAGTGTFTPQSFGGDGAPQTTPPSAAGSGTFRLAIFTGEMDATTAPPTADGAGTFHIAPRIAAGVAQTATPTAAGLGTFQHAACAAFQYEQHGREPISVCQVIGHGHDYPLVTPSEDIRYLIADLFLAYEDPYDYGETDEPYALPLHVAFLFGPGCLVNPKPDYADAEVFHDADILIRDDLGRDVFDSTRATVYRATDWGNRLRVHEWLLGAQVCRVALHTKWRAADDAPAPQYYDIYLEPAYAPIDARAIRRIPKRLRSIIFDGEALQGELELGGGFNTELIAAGSLTDQATTLTASLVALPQGGGRAGQRIQVNMAPGSGTGRAPGCEDVELNVTTINNVPPNTHGDFLLSGDACYWFEKTTQETTLSESIDGTNQAVVGESGVLTVHNDCGPCCECAEFVEVKLAIDNLYADWQEIANATLAIRNLYAENRERWLAAKECFDRDRQRLTLTASCLGYVGIGFIFCPTDTDGCVGPLDVRFNFLLNATDGDRDPPPPPIPLPDPDPDPEPDPGNSRLGPELLQNHDFAQKLEFWNPRGFAHENFPGVKLGRGTDLSPGGVNRDPGLNDPVVIIFGNGDDPKDWNADGLYGLVHVDPFPPLGIPGFHGWFIGVADNDFDGNNDGGRGRLAQTAAVHAGEHYRLSLTIMVVSGTVYLRVKDGDDKEIITEELTPYNEDILWPPSPGDAELEPITDQHVTFQAPDDQVSYLIENEASADDYLWFTAFTLYALSGRVSQTVSGIKPTSRYRAAVTMGLRFGGNNTGDNRLEILNANGDVIESVTLTPGSPAYKVFEKIFVANSTSLTFVVRTGNTDLDKDRFAILDCSLREVIDNPPGTDAPPSTGNPGTSQGAPTATGTANLGLKLLPDSGRKSEVGNKEMIPYDLQGEFPELSAHWDRVDSGQTAKVVFAVVPCNAIEGDSLTVTATATLDGVEFEPITKTVSLKFECPDIDELCSDS